MFWSLVPVGLLALSLGGTPVPAQGPTKEPLLVLHPGLEKTARAP